MDQTVARYVNRLHPPIQDQVVLHDLANIDDTHRQHKR